MGRKDLSQKSNMVREWIVFALCLGLGGHMALAVVLHAPEQWLWSRAGLYGLVLGVGAYGAVQLVLALWWAARGSGQNQNP